MSKNHFDIELRPRRISIDIGGYDGDEIARAHRKKRAERKARMQKEQQAQAQRQKAAESKLRQTEAKQISDDLECLNASLGQPEQAELAQAFIQ